MFCSLVTDVPAVVDEVEPRGLQEDTGEEVAPAEEGTLLLLLLWQ